MKFKIYHSKGASHDNPMEVKAESVEDAAAEVERITGGYACDASAFIPDLNNGTWIAVDIWQGRKPGRKTSPGSSSVRLTQEGKTP